MTLVPEYFFAAHAGGLFTNLQKKLFRLDNRLQIIVDSFIQ